MTTESGGKIPNIGVLIGVMRSRHRSEILHGIVEASKECNVNLFTFVSMQRRLGSKMNDSAVGETIYQLYTTYNYAQFANLDALIIADGALQNLGQDYAPDIRNFLSAFDHIPHFILGGEEENGNYIISDNRQGIQSIMDHLITDHGYSRFAFLSGPLSIKDAAERHAAFLDCMLFYGLPVDDGMVAFGDLSDDVEHVVEKLLDDNPSAQAIICANDDMCLAAYQVCKRRNRRIGVDIAITGYDDIPLAKSMNPPLTTIAQNGYDMGYLALHATLDLLGNPSAHDSYRKPAILVRRESCGCRDRHEKCVFITNEEALSDPPPWELYRQIVSRVVLITANKEIIRYYMEAFRRFDVGFRNWFLRDPSAPPYEAVRLLLMEFVREIVSSSHAEYASLAGLDEELTYYLRCFSLTLGSPEKKSMLTELMLELKELIYSTEVMKKEHEVISNRQNILYSAQIFAWELINQLGNQRSLYLSIAKKLYGIGIQSAYIFLLKKSKAYRRGRKWIMPDTLYLACSFDGASTRAYQNSERPAVDRENGFARFVAKGKGRNLLAMPLSAEDKQYGVILFEAAVDQVPLVRGLIQQIGAILCFSELAAQERTIRRQLEESVRLIREHNELLSVLSSVDALTGLLNRRGFMEQVIKLNRSNRGENACFLFADIDHLKEINDSQGHSEGDYAIITAARVLTECVGSHGIVGRVGGDEFLALFTSQDENFAKQLEETVHQKLFEINSCNGKPYYVELSIGTKRFVLSENMDYLSVIDGADGVLYRAKKYRRPSIIRKAGDSV